MKRRNVPIKLIDNPSGKSTIYAIRSGEYIKVGMTGSLERRLEDMRLFNPHPISVVLYRTVDAAYARMIEKRLHEMLREWHHSREWFTAPVEEIRKSVKLAICEAAKARRVDLRTVRAWRESAAAETPSRGECVENENA